MQLLGLLLLLASSWYIWKLTSNFLDEPTKNSFKAAYNDIKLKAKNIEKLFSKEFVKEAWSKYKEEDGVLANKKQD